jgi:hypothetical protein
MEQSDEQRSLRPRPNLATRSSSGSEGDEGESYRSWPSRSHNPKVAGSNPAPATMSEEGLADVEAANPFRLPNFTQKQSRRAAPCVLAVITLAHRSSPGAGAPKPTKPSAWACDSRNDVRRAGSDKAASRKSLRSDLGGGAESARPRQVRRRETHSSGI